MSSREGNFATIKALGIERRMDGPEYQKEWSGIGQVSIILPPITDFLGTSRLIPVNKAGSSLSASIVLLKDNHFTERNDLIEILFRLGSRFFKRIGSLIKQDGETDFIFISSYVKSFFHHPSSLKSAATLSIRLKARLAIPGGRYLNTLMNSTYKRQDISFSIGLSFLKMEVKKNEFHAHKSFPRDLLACLDPCFHLLPFREMNPVSDRGFIPTV